MGARLAMIAALVVFDVGIAALVSLGLIGPGLAVCLLLTNPLALLVEHRLRARRPQARLRQRD